MGLNSKTILITGATDGLGSEVARQLARPGVTLLLHGRNAERARRNIEFAQSRGATAKFYGADLESLRDVQRVARAIGDENRSIDIIINNAGIGPGATDERQWSHDGYELILAVNYLSHVLLTDMLLPTLAKGARIVNVSSAGQQPLDFDDLMMDQGYSGVRAYCQSKLAMIMWSFDLAEALATRGVAVTTLHPASMMDTTLVRKAGVPIASTVAEGAAAVLNLVEGLDAKVITGQYFDRMQPSRAHEQAYDRGARDRLRAATREMLDAGTTTR